MLLACNRAAALRNQSDRRKDYCGGGRGENEAATRVSVRTRSNPKPFWGVRGSPAHTTASKRTPHMLLKRPHDASVVWSISRHRGGRGSRTYGPKCAAWPNSPCLLRLRISGCRDCSSTDGPFADTFPDDSMLVPDEVIKVTVALRDGRRGEPVMRSSARSTSFIIAAANRVPFERSFPAKRRARRSYALSGAHQLGSGGVCSERHCRRSLVGAAARAPVSCS